MGSVSKRVARNVHERTTGWRHKQEPATSDGLTALQRAVAEQRKADRESLRVQESAG